MGIIVDKKDFIGKFAFQFQNNLPHWDKTIADIEELYLIGLFGESLFNKLKANPTDPDFQPILSPFVIGYGKTAVKCKGLKEVILGFVYCEITDPNGVYSANGLQQIESEVEKKMDATIHFTKMWNYTIKQSNAIRRKLAENHPGIEDYDFIDSYKYKSFLW